MWGFLNLGKMCSVKKGPWHEGQNRALYSYLFRDLWVLFASLGVWASREEFLFWGGEKVILCPGGCLKGKIPLWTEERKEIEVPREFCQVGTGAEKWCAFVIGSLLGNGIGGGLYRGSDQRVGV